MRLWEKNELRLLKVTLGGLDTAGLITLRAGHSFVFFRVITSSFFCLRECGIVEEKGGGELCGDYLGIGSSYVIISTESCES